MFSKQGFITVCLVILAALLITGCVPTTPAITPEPTRTPTTIPEDDETYPDLQEWLFGDAQNVTLTAKWEEIDCHPKAWGPEKKPLLWNCQHTGIDYAALAGTPVYSATKGKVIRVEHGKDGNALKCLSTVAIYDEATDVTFIYLHTKDIKVKLDAEVKVGDQIAAVGSRGPGGIHLHFEARDREQPWASDDVRKAINPYEAAKEARVVKYTLTVLIEGEGEVIPSAGTHTYEKGTVVELKAVPAAGWQFKEWIGDVAATGNTETTVLMDKDKTVKAVFIEEEDYIVEFEDHNLEQAVRMAIDKPEGPLYLSDVIGIRILNADERGIESLKGIQHLQNLEVLNFSENQVTDISVLQYLTKLRWLTFWHNQVTDISVLQYLTNLEYLSFWNNQVTDISVLQNLMTKLRWLDFSENQVTDISVLQYLTNLEYLYFSHNQVTDISALVKNEGSGDQIDMRYNYLDLTEGSQNMQDIETLISRGVIVAYKPQRNP